MRSFLTMLGIIIGITSVIAIVTVGNSMQASVNDQLSSFGTNNISVYVQEKSDEESRSGMRAMQGLQMNEAGDGFISRGSGERKTPASSDLITPAMIAAFEDKFGERLAGVSATRSAGAAQAKDGARYANVSIMGVGPAYEVSSRLDILDGRFLNAGDVESARAVCVVSDKFAANMFGIGAGALGKQVKMYKESAIELYTVVGVYKYEQLGFAMDSTASARDISTGFYIPLSILSRDSTEKNYSQLTVIAKVTENVITLTDDINAYFAGVYRRNDDFGVTASNMESQLQTVMDALNQISLAIAIIAAISLVVGGIGVMNIMLVSVTERTREIGTRKALGAKNSHIRQQFITEAAIMSVIGGIIGVILGTSGGIGLTKALGAPVVVDVVMIVGTIMFSMFIGIFFGFYPAGKAAKLDPIEALRYE